MKAITSIALLFGVVVPIYAAGIPNNPNADLVLGQANFTTGTAFAPPSPRTLRDAAGVAVDPLTGKVFVSQLDNGYRVLRFASRDALTNNASAEAVFGQINYSSAAITTSITGLSAVFQICVDLLGRLWVADFTNNRVLMYNNASFRGDTPAADLVLGQPDFTTASAGTSNVKMDRPIGVWLGNNDTLWVGEYGNHRVLRFDNVSLKASGSAANGVLGQATFATNTSGTTASIMRNPCGVFEDSTGHLWVADSGNNRVLRFDGAAGLSNGADAAGVLGQADFTSATSAVTASTFFGAVSGVIGNTEGDIFVTDSSANRILLFKNAAAKPPGSAASRVIGQPDFVTSTPGTAANKFLMSYVVPTIDPSGALWVPDRNNNRTLRFNVDSKPPVVKITTKTRVTSKAKLRVEGTATDANGVTRVRFRVGTGTFKVANGTTSWKFTVKLKKGKSRISVNATDSLSNTSSLRAITVKRL